MKRINRTATTLGATILLAGTCASLWADAKVNPYEDIAKRNPFALKDPPPPPDPSENVPKPPPAPLATVDVTGIINILGPPQVLLEIVPGPGKPMIKPVLREGERVESIEVVSINIQKNEVTIKNGGTLTNLTFKIAKSTPTTPPQPNLPGMVPKPAVPPVPPAQSSYNNQGSGRYNVMVAGGANSAAPAANSQNAGYGGVNPNAANLTGGTDGGFRSIPSRVNRTAGQPEMDPTVNRLQQYEQMEEKRAEYYFQEKLTGRPSAPLPPTPITPPDAPGINPRPNLLPFK